VELVAPFDLLRHDQGVPRRWAMVSTLLAAALLDGSARADGFHERDGEITVAARTEEPAKPSSAEEEIDLTAPAAPPTEPAEPDWRTPLRERRCGFSFGAMIGGVAGAARGYPNDALKIDREEFLTDTGVAGGGEAGAWLGVAITDWLALGLGGHVGRMLSADHTSDFFGGVFHLDVFPAYGLGGEWRELGLMLEAGVALSDTYVTDAPDLSVIESGIGSHLDLGIFYEGLRLWKLSMGPFVSADLVWSPSALRPAAWLGWRTALYAGP
jgi:hypothetical protein